MIQKMLSWYLILTVIAACQLTATGGQGQTGTLPTHTPAPGSTIPETQATIPVAITSSDGCEAVASASGISMDAEQSRAAAPRTLPNGNPFPATEPRSASERARSARSERTEVMIQFTPDARPDARNEYIRQIGGTTRTQIDRLNTVVVTLRPNTSLESLPPSAIVVRAEINEIAEAAQVADAVTSTNDARFAEQWAFPVVGLPQAWAALPAGNQVVIAVIDSGICAGHPDLQGRITAGYDFIENDAAPQDDYGHGCGVAGVIAANSNNSIGIAGVAPNTLIMPLRVLDSSGIGNYAAISAAIIYAADNGAQIINLSLAGPTFSQIMADAVAYAIQRGVIVVAAAGNFGRQGAYYPAAFPSVIAVGSIDPGLQHSAFSNYGADIDIWAPGRDILTTSTNGDYQFMSGTSFAAPIVAGLVAMSRAFETPLVTENGIVYLYPPDNLPRCP
jgi:thermitase